MAGYSSYDDLIAELTAGKALRWDFVKVGPAAEAAGNWVSHWYAAGSPGAGVDPATTPGTAYDDAAGSMNWVDVDPDTKHMLTFGASATVNCTLHLYDRLVGVAGIALNSTGVKTVNSVALPRYSGAAASAVQAWVEVTTATATTAPQVRMNGYTNEAGTGGRTGGSLFFPAAATDIRWMGPLPLQAGDKGVQSVEGLEVQTAGSAGVCNVVLLKPLVSLPCVANIWNERDMVLQLAGLDRVFDGASLALMQLATATTATTIIGTVRIGYG